MSRRKKYEYSSINETSTNNAKRHAKTARIEKYFIVFIMLMF